jgi:hypothetical protein
LPAPRVSAGNDGHAAVTSAVDAALISESLDIAAERGGDLTPAV